MYYELKGAGDRALLFIHGFGGFGGLWKWQVEYFRDRARTVTVDLPGHGRSPWATGGLVEMADGLGDVLKRAGVDSVHVVASSFGGLVALKFWERSPKSIKSISLVGSLPRFVSSADFPAGLTVTAIEKMSSQFNVDVGSTLDVFVRSFSTTKERESKQYALVKELRRLSPLPERRALQAFLKILETVDLREALWSASVPIQVISGAGDYICPPAAVDILRRKLPSARFDMFPDAGHGLFLTMPDDVNRVLSEWLAL